MIASVSRTKEWILESCEKNAIKDPTILEKTIRAFSLLEALAKSGCPFLFSKQSFRKPLFRYRKDNDFPMRSSTFIFFCTPKIN